MYNHTAAVLFSSLVNLVLSWQSLKFPFLGGDLADMGQGVKRIGLTVVLSLLAIAADSKGLVCLLIPSWHSHVCHWYTIQCFAMHSDCTEVGLSEQQIAQNYLQSP